MLIGPCAGKRWAKSSMMRARECAGLTTEKLQSWCIDISFDVIAIFEYSCLLMSHQRSQTPGDAPSSGELQTFKARFFKALAHPTRIRILEILVGGSRTVYELQEALTLEQSTVSQQLAVLRNHGIVTAQKEGLAVRYTVRDPLIGKLLDVARQIFNNHFVSTRALLRQLQRESRRVSRRNTP